MDNIAPIDSASTSLEQENKKSGNTYAEINEETATLLSGDDKIVFAPALDFEYTAPLEDFKKSFLAQDVS
jgi:hypothetical protein